MAYSSASRFMGHIQCISWCITGHADGVRLYAVHNERAVQLDTSRVEQHDFGSSFTDKVYKGQLSGFMLV